MEGRIRRLLDERKPIDSNDEARVDEIDARLAAALSADPAATIRFLDRAALDADDAFNLVEVVDEVAFATGDPAVIEAYRRMVRRVMAGPAAAACLSSIDLSERVFMR